MKTYERLKPWSLLFGLDSFTYELIDPQIIKYFINKFRAKQQAKKCSNFSLLTPKQIIFLLIIWGPNNEPRSAQISNN
jgi:hypothetical protein